VGESERLHLDEIALKKGHSEFETVIYTDTHVLETVQGKKSVDLQEVLKNIPGINRIKTVCIDMCSAFADAIRQVMPQAEIVADRFHLIKLLNKRLDKMRIKTYSKLTEAKQKRFSHMRFLLFRDYKVLNRDERRLVREYLRINSDLKTIYWLCQDFRRILNSSAQRKEASDTLMAWCEKARKYLPNFVKTIQSWWDEVVNACLFRHNNGRAEGINNKLKLLKRRGYGFRNRLNFRYLILATCNP
jgi:transposase